MSRPAKKSVRATRDAIASAKQAQEKVLEFGRGNVESLVHSAESCGRAMVGSLGLCSREINALAKSGTVAGETVRALGNMLMQGTALSFTHWTGFVRDVLKCGSVDDFDAVQEDYAHRLANDYFYEADKFFDVLFDSYEEALKPLNECVAVATKQARKALVA